MTCHLGYSQASYLPLENTEGCVHCSLVMGKSRVAPAKLVTVPRLELTATSLSVKVGYMLQSELRFEELKFTGQIHKWFWAT